MQVSRHQSRHRSATANPDPFNDPSNISYSSYGIPTRSRNPPLNPSAPRPPPPPPKLVAKSQAPHRPSTGNRENIMDAVRDTVTVRGADQIPRARVGRSQTELPPPTVARPAPAPVARRSHSQDPAPNAMDKGKSSRKKKGSSHADVIDRLDFSGVGPMFHHDGPFDACAPSRNRHRTKAPMLAWSAGHEADQQALNTAQPIQPKSAEVFIPYEAPKKKHDAIAEAWGIHEPEPFEDFSAGGGATSQHNGEHARGGSGTTRRTRDGRDARDVYREYLEENHPSPARRAGKRSIPPPQPIFVPESELDNNGPPSPLSAGLESPNGNAPRRNKSLMQRIRKMRDSPNIPVGSYEDNGRREMSPGPSGEHRRSSRQPSSPQGHPLRRPTHRSQGSFLGRFGRGANMASSLPDEPFVYVDHVPAKKDKSLPSPPKDGTPSNESAEGYFDGAEVGMGGAGLGRKTSLLKKVGLVKGRAK
ncbi:hypothetical protein V8D89_010164 [Ganoderma adspersum]